MLAKIVLACFLMTGVSLAKDDHDELLNTVLGSGTNMLKEFSKLTTDDDRFALDLNALYKKYEIESKADQARNFLQTTFKRGAELTNEYLKKANIEGEDQLKKTAEIIKKEDPVLGEKLSKFYEKSCDMDRLSEEIVKYILNADKVNGAIEKARGALRPLEHRLAESLKKFEAIVLEHLPKKGKN
ncbi:hypothetical protein AGLY_007838 [Aphis glycines]|uniref:Uncharacterized protein n=1 Tax=Aphis glycines TaxID=307491 RepID=A0A6G0TNQ4_APHGL|nr:hypothetical protein AGLY_007838 [Aphis glycines]